MYKVSRNIFSVLFLVATFGASAINIAVEGPAIKEQLVVMERPDSVEHLRRNISWIDEVVRTTIAGKYQLVEAFAYIQRLLGKQEYDDFANVISKDGYLNITQFYPPHMENQRELAARLARMRDFVAKDGGNIFYLTPPSLVGRDHPHYAYGLPYADANVTQDAFINHLREFGVESLDSRELLRARGIPHKNTVFRTDHHWTNLAAFEVFKALVPRLEKAFNLKLDPDGFYTNDANYNFRTYPKTFLGFLGRSTGASFVGFDDFSIVWPKFRREYVTEHIDAAGLNNRRGPAEITLLNTLRLRERKMYTSTMYDFYFYGILPWARLRNLDNPDGPKLMLVVDSFGPILATFLAPMFSEIQVIWPRAEFSKVDIDEFLEDNRFKYVMIELYAENLSENGIYFFADPVAPHQPDESKETATPAG